MPIRGSKHQGNVRMLECLNAMWEDFKNGKINECADFKLYTNSYGVTTIPKILVMPIITASQSPKMKDVVDLRKLINERQRITRSKKLAREAYLLDQQEAQNIQTNEFSESELVMKVISLGYAVFKMNIPTLVNSK